MSTTSARIVKQKRKYNVTSKAALEILRKHRDTAGNLYLVEDNVEEGVVMKALDVLFEYNAVKYYPYVYVIGSEEKMM